MPVILVSMINTGARSATRTAGDLTGGLADGGPRTTRPRRAPDATTPTRTLPAPARAGAWTGPNARPLASTAKKWARLIWKPSPRPSTPMPTRPAPAAFAARSRAEAEPAPGGAAAGAAGAGGAGQPRLRRGPRPADHRPSGGTPLGCGAAAGGVTGGEMAGHAAVAAASGLVVGPAFGMTAYAYSGGDGT